MEVRKAFVYFVFHIYTSLSLPPGFPSRIIIPLRIICINELFILFCFLTLQRYILFYFRQIKR